MDRMKRTVVASVWSSAKPAKTVGPLKIKKLLAWTCNILYQVFRILNVFIDIYILMIYIHGCMFNRQFLCVFIFVCHLIYPLEPDFMGSVQHVSTVLESERSGQEGHRLSAPGSKLRSSPHEGTADLVNITLFSLHIS